MFVVWAYDVVTAKNIVFDYLKHKFHTVYNDRETLRIVGATQFYAHTYVPAEYCNEYIKDEKASNRRVIFLETLSINSCVENVYVEV
mgnify:CR=1 FL=1